MPTIVIATDGSPESRRAVDYGIELAAAQHACAILLRVIPPVDWTQLDRGAALRPLPNELRLRPGSDLEEAIAAAAERGVDAVPVVVAGNPADEIVAYADSVGADLTIVGSRGHGPIAGSLLGSVSRDVLHESRRPVLVVPPSRAAA